jgi:hypothetical protein
MMRKRLIGSISENYPLPDQGWLELEHSAQVELTSEDAAHPIEFALVSGSESGWRAASSGQQTIRLIFDRPKRIERISLVFIEPENPRTQEFVLRWSPDGGRSYLEILRQQWTFSLPGAVQEVEDYRVQLSGVTVLELTITPDLSGGDARASLAQLRLA